MGYYFDVCNKCGRLQLESDSHQIKCTDKIVDDPPTMEDVDEVFNDMRYISSRMFCNFDTFWTCVDYWADHRKTNDPLLPECIRFIKNYGTSSECRGYNDFINYSQTKKDKLQRTPLFRDFKIKEIKTEQLPNEIKQILKKSNLKL